jgi:hypothetical protein
MEGGPNDFLALGIDYKKLLGHTIEQHITRHLDPIDANLVAIAEHGAGSARHTLVLDLHIGPGGTAGTESKQQTQNWFHNFYR